MASNTASFERGMTLARWRRLGGIRTAKSTVSQNSMILTVASLEPIRWYMERVLTYGLCAQALYPRSVTVSMGCAMATNAGGTRAIHMSGKKAISGTEWSTVSFASGIKQVNYDV